MELLGSNPDHSIQYRFLRTCQASLSEVCVRRGGRIEPERAANARYCSECASLVRREQSKQRKREMRRRGWRKYHNDYSPFNKQEWRAYHRRYMREWRARRKQKALTVGVVGRHCAA